MKPLFSQLLAALQASWDEHTGYAGPGDWSPSNPARAQCVTSSLVVQDYLGGDIVRDAVRGEGIAENHYYNILPDGTLIDTTRTQYAKPVKMTPNPVRLRNFPSMRARLLADDETRDKYELLKRRVCMMLEQGQATG